MNNPPRILVVAQSRLTHAVYAKYLDGHYSVREEDNGESAWQTLVLDSSVVAVIAETGLPRLDAFALLERMRANRLQRLQKMPLFLIVSGSDSEADLVRLRERGVAGFIARTMRRPDVLAGISRVLYPDLLPENCNGEEDRKRAALQTTNVLGEIHRLTHGEDVRIPIARMPPSRNNRLLARDEAIYRAAQAMGCPNCSPHRISVLLLELDSYMHVAKTLGGATADKIEQRLATVLIGRLGTCDSIGRYGPGQLTIVSCGPDKAACRKFASRVAEALTKAHVTLHGQEIPMSIAVGLACVPEDGEELTSLELFSLAERRLNKANQHSTGERLES
jgi:two-component system, cell cycle response regulator